MGRTIGTRFVRFFVPRFDLSSHSGWFVFFNGEEEVARFAEKDVVGIVKDNPDDEFRDDRTLL